MILGRVIAERTYELHTPSRVRLVTVRLGQPVPDPEPGGDWVCPVQFRGAPRGQLPPGTRAIYGVDGLQALILAVGYAQRALAELQRNAPGSVRWSGSSDLGLPDIIGLIGVRRMFRTPGRRRLVERRPPAR